MKTIDYYFSLLSPFTYLAGLELESIARDHNLAIAYKPMNIGEVFGQTGAVMPKDRHWSRQEYRLQELQRISEAQNMPINLKPAHWPTDVTFASSVLIAAANAGKEVGPFVHALLKAVWSDEKDIGDMSTVIAIANDFDINVDELSIDSPDAPTAFQANTREAIESGVFGSPFYILDGQRFWGQDRLPWLRRTVETSSDSN
ncbi:MAG: 2-hydroxychromene-2-carboxylate isomerase [marine bacterium B5-7]|nr:MAG: 2-hydroxychromene-2-carboxylate isomerase [marine bacterium B5-7]